MHRHRQLSIFAVVFIDLLGFGLILPLLPYYAETFDASSTVVGLLIASYSAAQLIGAPLLGRLSDRFGRRPVLMASIFGTLIGFLMLGFANSLLILFASRLLDGLTGGNISVARAYIADITDEDNRARGMGLIGAAFGLGFVIGPAAGGMLSAGERYALPAFVAAGLAAFNLIAVYLWLPESLDAARRAELRASGRGSFSRASLRDALARPGVGAILKMSFLYGLGFATFEGVFSLYAQKHLDLASDQTGYLLAYVGVLVAFIQGGAIGRLSRRFREERLILSAAAILVPSLLAWAYAPNVLAVMVILAPVALSLGVLSATIHSVLTKAVLQEEVGGVLGLSSALGSTTRIIGPLTGAALLDVLGTWAPGVLSAGLMVVLWWYARRIFVTQSHLAPAVYLEGEQTPV